VEETGQSRKKTAGVREQGAVSKVLVLVGSLLPSREGQIGTESQRQARIPRMLKFKQ
jgi:hypothetical protein